MAPGIPITPVVHTDTQANCVSEEKTTGREQVDQEGRVCFIERTSCESRYAVELRRLMKVLS
jgi:hypothetical protein